MYAKGLPRKLDGLTIDILENWDFVPENPVYENSRNIKAHRVQGSYATKNLL